MPADAPHTETTLELRDVSKYFGELAALRGVRLSIGLCEAVLLYGPNGAGKTTLLRTLAALARPSQGQVLFGGIDVHRNAGASKAKIGFVSHATFLYGELTGRENLRFAATLFGLRDAAAKVDAALDLFAVRDRADEPVRGLSRGLQQRVSLARAFLHDPDFLLLDEPFTGLDAASVKSLESVLRRVPDEGKSIVFSTHDFDQGIALARRLVALEGGRVRYDGSPNLAPLEVLRNAASKGRQ